MAMLHDRDLIAWRNGCQAAEGGELREPDELHETHAPEARRAAAWRCRIGPIARTLPKQAYNRQNIWHVCVPASIPRRATLEDKLNSLKADNPTALRVRCDNNVVTPDVIVEFEDGAIATMS